MADVSKNIPDSTISLDSAGVDVSYGPRDKQGGARLKEVQGGSKGQEGVSGDGAMVPPGPVSRLDRSTAVSDEVHDGSVPPSFTGSTRVPDAEVSMWARPRPQRTQRLRPVSPRREANNCVFGHDGAHMCLVCPAEADNGVVHNTEKPDCDKFNSNVHSYPAVTRQGGGDVWRESRSAGGYDRGEPQAECMPHNDNSNVNMSELGVTLSQCSEWLKAPVNAASAGNVNKTIAECLDNISAIMCKLSDIDLNVNSHTTEPRREARQMYQAINQSGRPRGGNVALFPNSGAGHAQSVARERPRSIGSRGGVVSDVMSSRQALIPEPIGQRMPCAFEALNGMNEASTGRSGGKKYTPGSVQHKVHSQGVSARTIEQALDGEYCELNEFLSPIGATNNLQSNLECVMDDENRLLYRAKRHTRKITNLDLWCQAWSVYEKLLIGVYGIELHSVMSDYRQFIMEANRKFNWTSIATYDFKHRSLISTSDTLSGRFDFSSPSQELLVTILDATAIRPNAIRCNKCRAYDHVAAGCPFPEFQKAQSQVKAQNSQVQNEICLNFNRDRCFNQKCRRIHKCKQCRGQLPYSKCILSGPCTGNSQVPTQQ